ncbi:MAG: GtrA family protein [Selenomonadaceae bacterium]|nr:GtrA family protein [Selenomonadaceae bacterium]
MQQLDKLKKHFLTREFFLFLVIGCINTFNGTFIAWLCAFLSPYNNLNFNIGYIIGNIIAYIMNSYIIFHETLDIVRYVKFFISYIPNYIIQNLIVLIFYNYLGFPPVVSYLLAAILGIPVTFLMVKIFAFGKNE